MPIKTQSAKGKGRKLQQHIRDRIYHWFPMLVNGDVESRSMGAQGTDIILSPLARDLIPLAIEAKNTKKVPSMEEVKQAQANARKNELPLLCWKPYGKKYMDTLAVVMLEDLLEWLSEKEKEQRSS